MDLWSVYLISGRVRSAHGGSERHVVVDARSCLHELISSNPTSWFGEINLLFYHLLMTSAQYVIDSQ